MNGIVQEQKEMREDREVKLVNLFITDLNQVVDEMGTVEKNDYYEVVLEAKLLKLMKSYEESLYLGTTMNVYRSHYKYVLTQREKDKEIKNMKITSTYKSYPVEITPGTLQDYSCVIPTHYGVEDLELRNRPIEYILSCHQGVVSSYKNLGEIAPNERIYHVLEVEYKESTLKSYYNYNINQTFFNNIVNAKDKKTLTKKDLDFIPSTNTEELISQFISFIDEKDKLKSN